MRCGGSGGVLERWSGEEGRVGQSKAGQSLVGQSRERNVVGACAMGIGFGGVRVRVLGRWVLVGCVDWVGYGTWWALEVVWRCVGGGR